MSGETLDKEPYFFSWMHIFLKEETVASNSVHPFDYIEYI